MDPGWDRYTFHNILHTQLVVDKAKEWSSACKLNEQDSIALKLAAWYHDIGYLNEPDNHEEESIRLFLLSIQKETLPPEMTDMVVQLIRSTKQKDTEKRNELENMIHDMDRVAMGMTNFMEWGQKLRTEWKNLRNAEWTDKDWIRFQIEYLNMTHFKTDHGRQTYGAQKALNLQELKNVLGSLT